MPDPQYISPEDLAQMLNVPVGTVYQWRTRGVGPAGFRVGKHVRYRREDVERWIAEQMAADPRSAA